MTRADKSAFTDQQKRQAGAIEKDSEKNGVSRPRNQARAWPAVNDLRGGGKKIDLRRKLPSGPLGGSGRKTNLARSS